MKILVISYFYAPKITPRAFRWTALCEKWEELGHDVHVITGLEPRQLREEIIGGVKIHRVSGTLNLVRRWVLRDSNYKLNKNIKEDGGNIHRSSLVTFLTDTIRKVLRKIHDLTWKKVYWPDAMVMWVWPAIRRARLLLRSVDIDVLITVAHPFSDHLVGYLIRLAYPNLGWLADNGDPFAFSEGLPSNNLTLYRRVNFSFERKILESANYFTVTTEETKRLYLTHFGTSPRKIIVIPPLLNPLLEKPDLNDATLFEKEAIILLFVGIFYREIRGPGPLLRLIDKLIRKSEILNRKLQLHVMGPVDVISEELKNYPHIASRVFLHGVVSHRKAISGMFNANCLVNIGNTTAYQLPSKVIEYMATGLPILNLYAIPNDSSVIALRNYPKHLDLNIENNMNYEKIIHFVESSYRREENRCNNFVEKYRLDEISKHYICLLNRILNRQ